MVDKASEPTRRSRRSFLKSTGAAIVGGSLVPAFIPSTVLGAKGLVVPSERITLASVGLGPMGSGNLRGFLNNDDVQVVAVCDVDSIRSSKARDLVNRHYQARTESRGAYQGCDSYNDFRNVLARDDIDAVVISTPDHWHAPISVAAVKAGKDVYCEKPLTLTIEEGRILSDAVKQYGRVFQTGSQQRSSDRFRFACGLVRNGRIGTLGRIEVKLPRGRETENHEGMPVPGGFDYDMWLGQAPWQPYHEHRCHYNFRFILDYSGGQVTNFGAHNIDIAQWGHGTELSGPVDVEGKGRFPEDGLWNTAIDYECSFTYADGVKLWMGTNGFHVRFEGSDGWVYVSRGRIDAEPKSLLDEPISADEIHLYESRNHKRNFLDCIKTRNQAVAPAEVGHRTVSICHLANIAMLLGRKLKWDPERECFPNDSEANRMMSRPMRSPWRI